MQGSSSFKAGGRYYSFQVNRKRKSVYVNYKEVSKQSTIVTFIKKNKWLKISQIRCKLD